MIIIIFKYIKEYSRLFLRNRINPNQIRKRQPETIKVNPTWKPTYFDHMTATKR